MMRKFLNVLLALAVFASIAAPCAMAEDGDVFFKPGDEYKDVDFDNKNQKETVNFVQSSGLVSYSDVSDEDMEKVGILGALKVMEAYEGSEFKPNVYVSRAEYVEALMKLFKLDYEHEPGVNGKFYDVDKDSKYYNLVYNAYESDIACGYKNNNFYPEQVLTYEEAKIFAVKALGYGGIAEHFGDNYSKIFTDLKLNKNLSIKNAGALTRIDIAGILYNVLNTQMLDMAYFNNDGTYTTKKGDTPLYKVHNAVKGEGIITANRVTGYDGNGTGRNTVIINGIRYDCPDGLINSYIGYNTVFWYDDDSNDILFIFKKKDTNEIIAKDKDIVSFDIRSRTMVYYDGKRNKTVHFYENAPVFYNGVLLAGNYGADLFNIKAGSIRMISNAGSRDEFDSVFIESYDNYYVTSSSIDKNLARIFVDFDDGMLQFDLTDAFVEIYDSDGSYFEVYKTTDSGEDVIDISAVSNGKIASIYADNQGWRRSSSGRRTLTTPKYVKIRLSDKTSEGKINSYNTEDGELDITSGEENITLPVSGSNYFDRNDSMPQTGKTGTFALDFMGEAVCIKTGKSDFKYGYIMKVYYNENDDKPERIRFFTTGGKTYTYGLAEDFRINGVRYKNGEKYRQVISEAAQMVNPGFECQQVMKYKLDTTDEENPIVSEIQLVTQSVGIAPGYDSTQLNRDCARGNYSVENDCEDRLKTSYEYAAYFKPSLTITVPMRETTDSSRFSAAQITSSPTFSADIYNVNDLVPELMVRFAESSAEEAIPTDERHAFPFMYDKSKVILNEDNEVRLEITVASGWEVRTLYSENLQLCDNLKKGDLAYFYQIDDLVTKCTPVVWTISGELAGKRVNAENLPNINSLNNLSLRTNGEQSYGSFGEVWSVNGSDFVVQYGPMQSNGKREKLITGRFSHKAWMHGGVILYQEEDDGIMIRQGTVADLRPANTWGDKASKIVWIPIHGAGRQYVIFNFR
ncbi:MAG: S-layer homology domain-containing protein [Clostridiales bacterium]|nr:S-layer homology domain-containing protein [Clostridiales bacterium]